jgi:hypothetical protein
MRARPRSKNVPREFGLQARAPLSVLESTGTLWLLSKHSERGGAVADAVAKLRDTTLAFGDMRLP